MPDFTWIQWLAIWFLVSVAVTPVIGSILRKRRIRNELRELLYSSDADWAVEHRKFMQRVRSGQEVRLSRDALIDAATEECREWEGAFMDSEEQQPHSDPPRAA